MSKEHSIRGILYKLAEDSAEIGRGWSPRRKHTLEQALKDKVEEATEQVMEEFES